MPWPVYLMVYGDRGGNSRSRTRPSMSSARGLASGLSLPTISSDAVPSALPRNSSSAICGALCPSTCATAPSDEKPPNRPVRSLRLAR